MAMSTYTLDFYDLACEELNIGCGLQSIGETRFVTIHWSLESVLVGFPAFEKIACEHYLNGIDSDVRESCSLGIVSALMRISYSIRLFTRSLMTQIQHTHFDES